MTLNFKLTDQKFSYLRYIAVMTALRAFSGDVILWVDKEPDSKYYDLLKRINMRIKTKGEPKKKALVVSLDSITLMKFDGYKYYENTNFLFEDVDIGEFPDKDVCFLKVVEPPHLRLCENYVANSHSVYGELVKKLLPERVWNPFKYSEFILINTLQKKIKELENVVK